VLIGVRTLRRLKLNRAANTYFAANAFTIGEYRESSGALAALDTVRNFWGL
jgi:hypothetical protein